jgi:hypothetical protein
MPAASIIPTGQNISQANTYLDEASRQVQEGYTRTDAGTAQRRLTTGFERMLPQLQSSAAAGGQFYSSNRKRDEQYAASDFLEGSFDIQQQMQRRLDDFTRQRLYASVGLIGV